MPRLLVHSITPSLLGVISAFNHTQSPPCRFVLPLQSLQVPEAGLECSLNDREAELRIRMRMSYFLTVFH